jgi:hypothetical protein
LISSLKAILRGEFSLYSPGQRKFATGYLLGRKTGREGYAYDKLSVRGGQVFNLVAEGYGHKEAGVC